MVDLSSGPAELIPREMKAITREIKAITGGLSAVRKQRLESELQKKCEHANKLQKLQKHQNVRNAVNAVAPISLRDEKQYCAKCSLKRK